MLTFTRLFTLAKQSVELVSYQLTLVLNVSKNISFLIRYLSPQNFELGK